MSLHVFNVDLVGPTFTIQTDESLDYMQSLIMRLRERLGSLKESTRVSDPLRLSILLNITLMDELQRARERSLESGVALDSSEEEGVLRHNRAAHRRPGPQSRALGWHGTC
jgi:cell division protein ZapA (FtsZ GTPase activity inhibitor)